MLGDDDTTAQLLAQAAALKQQGNAFFKSDANAEAATKYAAAIALLAPLPPATPGTASPPTGGAVVVKTVRFASSHTPPPSAHTTRATALFLSLRKTTIALRTHAHAHTIATLIGVHAVVSPRNI
jgi:hypothetical protein